MNAKRAVKTVSVNMRKTKVDFWARNANWIVEVGVLLLLLLLLLGGILK